MAQQHGEQRDDKAQLNALDNPFRGSKAEDFFPNIEEDTNVQADDMTEIGQ